MSEIEWIEIFGDNLVDMLREHRMSQRDLADATGLTESAISNYIHKRRAPNIKALINIAYVMDCSMDDLIDFGEQID